MEVDSQRTNFIYSKKYSSAESHLYFKESLPLQKNMFGERAWVAEITGIIGYMYTWGQVGVADKCVFIFILFFFDLE